MAERISKAVDLVDHGFLKLQRWRVRELFETDRCPNEVYYYAIWSIWSQLGSLYKLYWLLLSLVSFYFLFSAVSIVRYIRASNDRGVLAGTSRIQVETRIVDLRQVISAMFFVFGALFFVALPTAFDTLALSKWPQIEYVGNFRLHFAFAANVFFVLLLLHCVQWAISSRLNARRGR